MKKRPLPIALLILTALMFAMPVSASTVKSLPGLRNIKSLDFNGDGKKDTFS